MADKAFLVIVKTGAKNERDPHEVFEEMKELTESANGTVVGTLRANAQHPSPSHYIRGGKIGEIREELGKTGANVLIFSIDLSPVQARNLEEDCGVRVVDRTGLILDIFARRAVSSDGKLQVELAQLQYLLPRLVGQGVIMSRLGGGIGTRGPGEQKLEVDRRKIRGRIEHIKGQIEKLRTHRAQLRQGRRQKGLSQVAIVGYTNAGKSTLLNALTGADAYVEDRLFATLDPKTRVYEDKSGRAILFTDTVGFIRDLPHGLVKAFHATLEETLDADLILIVVDAASDHALQHKEVVEKVLEELGAASQKRLLALNKADLLAEPQKLRYRDTFPEAVQISAATGSGLKELIAAVQSALIAGQCSSGNAQN
ncbi:MAG TPA: GTPase HflX [Candidatus Omnitrophota bacterium]|nr:GTPase HflX [Candidatus Omnitrophota bacterium]HPS36875.1 GTPase HflX [Candidatus Omnitrophota bacterium]